MISSSAPWSFPAFWRKVRAPEWAMVPRVLDHLLPVHANAGVSDGERLGRFVDGDVDGQLRVRVHHLVVGEQLELRPVEGVRGVGNQLAQKDFPV